MTLYSPLEENRVGDGAPAGRPGVGGKKKKGCCVWTKDSDLDEGNMRNNRCRPVVTEYAEGRREWVVHYGKKREDCAKMERRLEILHAG